MGLLNRLGKFGCVLFESLNFLLTPFESLLKSRKLLLEFGARDQVNLLLWTVLFVLMKN